MLERIDPAEKEIQVAFALQTAKELGFRKRTFNDAVATLAGVWQNGYIFVRAVYGTVLTPCLYSKAEVDWPVNGQRLIDYAEGIDDLTIFGKLAGPFQAFRRGLLTAPEFRTVIRKLGPRQAEAVLVTAWARGIATGVAEHELFLV